MRAQAATVLETWRARCAADSALRPGDEIPSPGSILDAIALGLDRPQPIEVGADDEVQTVAASFADYEPPVTIAARQLLYLEAAVLDELRPRYAAREQNELRDRSHVLTTWLVTHIAVVRLRSIALASLRHPLTGLFSKQAFHSDLTRALDELDVRGSTVVAIDLDNFKRINDSLGHAGGDDALKRFAVALTQATASEGSAYHLSGDEFALLLHSGDPSAVIARAQADSGVQCSFGVVDLKSSDEAVTAEEIHDRADQQLLRAKRAKKSWLLRLGLRISRGLR